MAGFSHIECVAPGYSEALCPPPLPPPTATPQNWLANWMVAGSSTSTLSQSTQSTDSTADTVLTAMECSWVVVYPLGASVHADPTKIYRKRIGVIQKGEFLNTDACVRLNGIIWYRLAGGDYNGRWARESIRDAIKVLSQVYYEDFDEDFSQSHQQVAPDHRDPVPVRKSPLVDQEPLTFLSQGEKVQTVNGARVRTTLSSGAETWVYFYFIIPVDRPEACGWVAALHDDGQPSFQDLVPAIAAE